MTDSRRNNKKAAGQPEKPIIKRDFTDEQGIPQRVLVPESETDWRTGIPLSLDLSPLFGHMPTDFQRELYQSLRDQGLVEPKDYFQPGAGERFRAAMLSVIRHDFSNAQALAQEAVKHG